ncbi:MAG TPA: hypothetical protein PKM01_12170 [Anaerolineaceae bacterium]|nr:hypothetical protein [Anaerolineaceae bacterium]
MTPIQIGRLLRSTITNCVMGCRVTEMDAPAFGGMVRIPQAGGLQIYGLIYDMTIEDDGLVRQLVTAENISDDVILDNRINRNVPVEISVLFIGYAQGDAVHHLLPPRPPLTLDTIFPCTPEEICRFTAAGRFGYFRHLLRAADLPLGELLAAHLQQTAPLHTAAGNPAWLSAATQELITLLRDDYPRLMEALATLGDLGFPI